ncbi:ABC transporter permease [Metapseudomonas furukawaii]|jgi:polar amino acid transport system permease protein|uniref:Arginine transport system permease protein ArtQ n=1 Tax=Metapseudomonas furukawaii TaxID=1149133 RepID=A0AAD1FD84_METFU|nr:MULTISPECIES: ABC transporter permease subunit [Pseudomonas]ELS28181.1 Arginine transport system permease protein ArtQ [Pseudomonas furukawaii]OWJ90833.1 ABC transporter permease [Pseudomonas sp. A46]WAG79343.1 ABC transporter permease subunit [Pseudomonas furukawaii]BAU71906.1 arginine transport system permease protein ArtQ [Pseudomonas furukawaii]
MFEQLALLSLGEGGWGMALLAGALVTLSLALACLPLGLSLGLLVALGARSPHRGRRALSSVFATVFRGLPELLTLLIVYYGCQIGVQKLLAHFGHTTEVSINAFLAAMIAFSLVFAAFSSQVWLGAFKVIGKGQYEAAQVLGLSRVTTFFRVILPQLTRVALPGLSNNWLSLLKDTSLVSTISLVDVMRQTNLAVSATKEPMLFYGCACLIYLFFSALSGRVFSYAEKRYSLGHRSQRA